MSARSELPADLPELAELGYDLLETSSKQRILSLSRPFLWAAAYWLFAGLGWWPLAIISVMMLFITIVASAHDLVHNVLGLPPWLNDILLAGIGMLVLESGHAYKATHLQHHRMFPHEDDPEGDPARMGFWRTILEGPIFLFRLWVWAWGHRSQLRRWLLFEALWFVGSVCLSLLAFPYTAAPLIYVGLVISGSWVYPLTTVHLPHNTEGENALFQTYSLRGRIIPKLFLELTYHLEHHLYPAVPSHQYRELSRRLQPYFEKAGVKPVKVW